MSELLQEMLLLKDCPAEERATLASLCTPVCCGRGAVVYEAGSPVRRVFFVCEGRVELVREGEADEYCLGVVLPGELFGIGELMLPAYYVTARTLERTALLAVDREVFLDHFLAIPAVLRNLIRDYNEMARILITRVTDGAGVRELILYLQQAAVRWGVREGWKIRITRKQRQPAIAAVLHMSREHVTRLFGVLKEKGAVDFNGGFPLLDAAWLERAVGDKDLAASIRYRSPEEAEDSDPHH